jgi:hypothetical protein
MKIYKVNWTINTYVKDTGISSREVQVYSSYKFTTDKDKANNIVKELVKSAEYLGIPKHIKTSVEELEAD